MYITSHNHTSGTRGRLLWFSTERAVGRIPSATPGHRVVGHEAFAEVLVLGEYFLESGLIEIAFELLEKTCDAQLSQTFLVLRLFGFFVLA